MKNSRKYPATGRFPVESLERRQLLAGHYDSATLLLQHRVLDAAGMTAAQADAIQSTRNVHAAAAVGVRDVAYWSPLSLAVAATLTPTISAVRFQSRALDLDSIADVLRSAPKEGSFVPVRSQLPALSLPTPDGGFARFGMQAYDLLAPSVARQFPDFQSIRLYGIDDNTAVGTATLTSLGLSAFVSSPDGDWYVNPIEQTRGGTAHASYFNAYQFSKADGAHGVNDFCLADDEHAAPPGLLGGTSPNPDALITLGATRRTYRIVIGATAEYTQQFGPFQPPVIQTSAFASINNTIAIANTIFGRDMNIAFQIVSDLRTVYTDTSTDGYTNGNVGTLCDENEPKMNSIYGNANFDLGHVFSQGGISGVATTFVVGGNIGQSFKAKAASSGNFNSPDFNTTVFHEMGHQTGSDHTYNDADDDGREVDSALEPGPGSTLMSYGGVNLGYPGAFVPVTDPYFHHRSIDQSEDYLESLPATVGFSASTGDIFPVANAGVNRSIPTGTPFELTAAAYDLQGNDLTYTWEQYDLGTNHLIGSDDGTGPLFRSRLGTRDTTRMFPELADVLANRVDADEFLPTMPRTADPLTFRLTVRDQLGGVSDDVIDLPVVNTGAAFSITSQNAGANWAAGSNQTVTWNVAGTTGNGINTANVDIFVSYDAGVTFTPVSLNVPNNGSRSIQVPTTAPNTTTARIKVKGSGNYFFDINNANITITGNAPLNGLPTTAPIPDATIYAGPGTDFADSDFPKLGAFEPRIDFNGDDDTVLFAPDATAAYQILAGDDDSVNQSDVDTVLAVYDNLTGAQVAINDDISASNVDSSINVILEAGKLYRISVADFGANDTGDVFLSITGSATMPTTPISLDANGDGSISGKLVSGREAKFHTLVAPSFFTGGTIAVTAPNSNLVASLYDTAGQLVAFNNNGSFDSAVGTLTPGATYILRVGARNFAEGGGDYSVNINFATAAAAVPSAPDLAPGSDSGVSSTDNTTNQNTSIAFQVSAPQGQFIRLFRDGVLVAGPTIAAAGNTASLSDTGPVPDGAHVYTATGSLTANGAQSALSQPTTVTIDTVAPTQNNFSFRFNDGPQDQLLFIDYTEPIFGFTASDPVTRNLTTAQILPASNFTLTSPNGGMFNDYTYNPTAGNDRFPTGNYEVSIAAGAATDLAGNATAATVNTFYFLDADANRDRSINIGDFSILAARFNLPGTFSQGDFNYSGTTEIGDFSILASKFNTNLPAARIALANSGDSPTHSGATVLRTKNVTPRFNFGARPIGSELFADDRNTLA